MTDYGSLFKFVYGFRQPDKLYRALLKYGFRAIRESDVSWLMKDIGVIEAHEPDCFLKSFHPEGIQ
jgi:DNA-3-methyladenine glycosylase I